VFLDYWIDQVSSGLYAGSQTTLGLSHCVKNATIRWSPTIAACTGGTIGG
jgi:hypothetical protein